MFKKFEGVYTSYDHQGKENLLRTGDTYININNIIAFKRATKFPNVFSIKLTGGAEYLVSSTVEDLISIEWMG